MAWLRSQPDREQAVLNSYFDDPVNDAAQRYAQSEEWQATWQLLRPYRPHTVLDVGAGRGIASYALAQAGCQVTALEPDASSLVGAGAIHALVEQTQMPIQVVQEWGEQLPFADASFDLVYGRAVLHHAHDLPQFCQEVARVLKPGGLCLFTREHVLSKREDLPEFLENHLLHWLYGGEMAYLLSEYLQAIRGATLRVEKTIAPFESVINYAPMPKKRFVKQLTKAIAPYVGENLAKRLAQQLLVQTIYGTWRSQQFQKPGRHYSFLARKPSAPEP